MKELQLITEQPSSCQLSSNIKIFGDRSNIEVPSSTDTPSNTELPSSTDILSNTELHWMYRQSFVDSMCTNLSLGYTTVSKIREVISSALTFFGTPVYIRVHSSVKLCFNTYLSCYHS